MTLASKITLGRIFMVPVFAVYVARYGMSVAAREPDERLRWTALALFVIASATDGVDGWIARRFNQKSKFGAFIDPLADKFLLITAIVFLSAFPWGEHDWRMPQWFAWLVITRDTLIVLGIILVKRTAREVHYSPHWTGKVCTVTQMFAIGWVMLKVDILPPLYPCLVAALFTLWSAVNYYLEASRQLRNAPVTPP
ncbi:CDP-alcohol phosphatidyltransferase family protein [Luteolibacter marinus]|uniref:CDP-alcohol phosphatidyltransferase family protein n=1 Tax=Luteolibacter marinus TaxID=2776705 RepID=UPI001866DDBB|nr:CDP-alcohol phosphatidyltransferase family protein [Luteolibacter marinus]